MTTPGRKRQSAFLPRPPRRLLTGVPLSWALTVPFVLLTVGATTLVGYLSYQSGEQTVTELASQLMQEKENQTVLYLERSLEMPHLVNQLNASNIRLGQLSGFETINPEPLEKFFWAQLQLFPDVTTIAMANDRGGMVGSGRRLPLGSGNMSVYRTVQFAKGKYTLSLTDAKGRIIETQTISENYDARTRPWYQAPAKAGKATWSPIYQFISDVPVMGISAGLPIYSDSGKLRGILAADIDLKSLSHFLSNLNLSPSGQVFIVERSGLLVANSTNQSILRTQAGEAERMNAGESEDSTMRETMAQLNARSHHLSQINGTQQFTIEQSNSAKWVRVTPFQDRYGLDWLIVIVVPESDFMQAIHANQATTLLLCLLTLGGAIGLGIFATNRLTQHFTQLNHVSQELAAGNLNRRLLTNGSIAELNGLAHTFNRMADQIQDSFDRIKTALAESKEKFTTVFRISPEPLAITNFADGCLLEINESAMQFYGYSRAEIIGNTALQLNFWHELEQREQYRSLLAQQGSVRNLEVQVRLNSGEVKTVLLSAEVCKLEGQDQIIVTHRDITDRKAAELALQQSEARYRAIVEDQTELVCRSLPDTTVTFVNDACCRYFGVNREEMIGKSYRHLIYEPDRAEVERNITSLSIDQPIITSENRWVVNGEVRWMQWSDRLLFDKQGNPIEIQSVGRDITHLKQAEEALRQSEERNRAILSAMPDLMTLIGADGIYRDIVRSNSLVDLIPLDVNPIGKHFTEFVSPEVAAIKLQLIQQTLETGEMQTLEQRLWLGDGWQYEEVRAVPCGSDAVLMMIRDITDRKQTEIALQQSENRFQRIAAASPAQIYILVCDAKGSNLRFEYISPGIREIQELEPEQVLQDATLTYAQVHPDDLALYDEATWRSFKTLEPFSHEWRIITPSGTVKWVQANSRPERRDNGDIAWYGVLLDITERKRVEDEHKQAEIALQESEARFQEIAQTISQIFFVLDLTTDQYLYISPSYEKLWGYSSESLYRNPKSWLDRIHPDDVEYVMSEFNQIPDDNRNLQEYRLIAADGTIHWMRAESWIVRNEDGNPIREVRLADDITDSKQAEEALRQSEAALRRAQQVAHVGSWQIEVLTGRVTWTEESFHIMGWDIAQLEPSLPQFYELIYLDDRDLLRQRVEAVIADQIPYRVEFRVIHPDGSLRYVEARGEAVVNEEGRTTHVIGTNLDITERKQAEDALRNSEATKNQILKAIPDLILWMTENGTCIDLIEGNSTTNLYNKSEAVGKNLYEILPFDLAQIRVNAIQQALKTGEAQIYEQEVALQSGTTHEEVRVIGVGDDRVLVIVRNITDRKRAEAALLDSETRFRSAFWDAPIGMALIGLDDRWIKVNPMLCDMLGFTEPELLSETASSLVHPEDWHKLEQCVQQVLSSENRNAQVELRYCCQQGQVVWGLTSLSLVRDGQGKPLYYVAQIQDITERQAIDRMKNEFISIVSHELRTPLTAIRGFLGLLDTGIYDKKPEKAKHMIGQALTNSDRLVRLVNDILDLERLSSGKVQIIEEACGAEDLMQRAAAGVQSLADQANVRLIIVPTTAQAWADPDCIIQTLTNLLSNAIKFSPPDAAITLSAQTRTDSVLFSVQDQGRGIPADKLETIFGRFQQVDVSDSRQKGGTGLGLAICRSIVQQHGGSIWAESILGNGSTFYFTLPLMSEGER
ncbi:PAS domain S-box protein [Leptolyngbya ohadii]|uniref:PAS domain S-box protein n=1 Tax=Leptolyngbya ohadii TaxID=1962290 RepID=UPI000B59BD85|nr:PAS domain S-box protein [Leptolyngbya ohadii]